MVVSSKNFDAMQDFGTNHHNLQIQHQGHHSNHQYCSMSTNNNNNQNNNRYNQTFVVDANNSNGKDYLWSLENSIKSNILTTSSSSSSSFTSSVTEISSNKMNASSTNKIMSWSYRNNTNNKNLTTVRTINDDNNYEEVMYIIFISKK